MTWNPSPSDHRSERSFQSRMLTKAVHRTGLHPGRFISGLLSTHWSRWAKASNVRPGAASTADIADYLWELREAGAAHSVPGVALKAMRFIAKHAKCGLLWDAAGSSLARAHIKGAVRSRKRGRKEAPALPYWVIVAWEKCVCSQTRSRELRLLLGGFLACL